jgi:hypothetical protein
MLENLLQNVMIDIGAQSSYSTGNASYFSGDRAGSASLYQLISIRTPFASPHNVRGDKYVIVQCITQMAEVLLYNSKSHGIGSRWGNLIISLT